ncbi:uncharacterized protein LOC115672822 [Syzygium oleosum]|uniref:uncharacterized protein LOC115672822 n=1 Tax=Syzygium oleosum TaxID=219896 RepID=UPI0011D2C20A|nr:uncharacterized protein LOC115672822 [Syzygium oleosum]
MRNKGSGFLKQILGALAGLTRAKSLALKSKTNALKARVLLLSLLRNRRLVVESISHKLHGLLGPREPGRRGGDEGEDGGESAAVVVYAHGMARGELVRCGAAGDEEAAKYPDHPRQSMFELEDFEDPGGSVIDLVKNSKQEGEDFVLEDEIDRVADLFIRRFHRQIRMQKQLSLKRFNEALDRSPR